jgi:hypothetical protein
MKKTRGLYHVFERRYLNFSFRTFLKILVIHTAPTVHSGRVGTVATSVKNGKTGIKKHPKNSLKDLIAKIMLFNSTKTLISLIVNIRQKYPPKECSESPKTFH